MDCREEYESLKLATSMDRIRLMGFHSRCCLEAPDLAQKAKDRCDELEVLMEQEWADACATDRAKAYKAFVKRWPHSDHLFEAEKEIEKRSEFLTSLINKKNKEGKLETRWQLLLILAPIILVGIGVGCLLLLGMTALALSWVGLPSEYTTAAPVLAVAVLVISLFGFGSETGPALMSAIFVSVFPVLIAIIFRWIGLGSWVSGFYQATGL